MDDKLLFKYQEFLDMPYKEKEKLASILFMRIKNSIAMSLKDKNTVLAESMLLAHIRNVVRASKGPTIDTAIFIMHISGHIFDYESELDYLLEESYIEHHEDLDSYLANKNRYVYIDLLELSMIIMSMKEEVILFEKEKEILTSLHIE